MNNSEFENLLKNALKDEKNPPDILNQRLTERISRLKKKSFWQNYNVKALTATAAAVIIVCVGAFNSKSFVVDYLRDTTTTNVKSELAKNETSNVQKGEDEKNGDTGVQDVKEALEEKTGIITREYKKEKVSVQEKKNNTMSQKKSESKETEQNINKNENTKSKTDRLISDLLPIGQEEVLEVAMVQAETTASGGMLARGIAVEKKSNFDCVLINDDSLTQEESKTLNEYVNAYISNQPVATCELGQTEAATAECETTENENIEQYKVLNNSENYYSVRVKLPNADEEHTTKNFTLDKKSCNVVGLSEVFSEYEDYCSEISDRVNQQLDKDDKAVYISAGDEDFYINEKEEVVITFEHEDGDTRKSELNIGRP